MTQLKDNQTDSRFEWEEDGIVSFADYAERGGVRAILHVETPQAARGRGAAGRLMKAIVDEARAKGYKLTPVCGYAAAHFRRYPETRDVLA
ncbi:MAG: GNAT family N-acetyltransferase [Hyphomonadaceae bacterium]